MKIKLSRKELKKLVDAVVYYKRECKKKDIIIDALNKEIISHNERNANAITDTAQAD